MKPTRLADTLTKWSTIMIIQTLLIAVMVLIGWIVGNDVLKRVIPNTVAMNPMTASLFIFISTAYFLLLSTKTYLRKAGQGLLILVLLLALVKSVQYIFGFSNGIDTWLFTDRLEADRAGKISNRMAINTAFCFMVLSIALLLVHQPHVKRQSIGIKLALINFFLVLLSLIGYIFSVEVYYEILEYLPMALHTTINFLLISLAIFFLFPQRGFMQEIISARAGGVTARKILPAVFFIPIWLGGLVVMGEWQEWYGHDFGLAVFCLGIIILFLITSWKVIKSLNQIDLIREQTYDELQQTLLHLKEKARQLEASNKELESFSYTISHDLRAPLRAISGYANILGTEYEEKLDEDARKMLRIINNNTNRMSDLINDLLRYAKVGREGIQRVNVDVEQLARDIFDELRFNEQSEVRLQLNPMPKASADYTMVAMLYQNLIANAIKFSARKSSPQISIGSFKRQKQTVYYVQDNGVGFDMRHYDKLFGVFHRLHKRNEFEGTGVGLAIAHKVVEAHQGRIWAESEIDHQTTFYFTLRD